MHISSRGGRPALVIGLVVSLVALSGWSIPALTVTYLAIRNVGNSKCLHGSSTSSKVWLDKCTGSMNQQWHMTGFVDDDWAKLRNRKTGRCLTSDLKSSNNNVWQGDCGTNSGVLFRVHPPSHLIYVLLRYNYALRGNGDATNAVYNSRFSGSPSANFKWTLTNIVD